ncbi:MAG: nucleotidyltransferase [Lachnospiraceae bacterium]|nr:nucleotidyltransferase [Lachnospiraceae bacterium]
MAIHITGIIAEYNPFHKGHAYHLAQARALTGADYLLVVQSGDFVQRGEPALTDKYCRAHMALAEGADLVLELPAAYACASAETFAFGAMSLLNSLGCVDALCFGSECGDLSLLSSYAEVLYREPDAYRELLKTLLRQGYSFPLARSKALEAYLAHLGASLSGKNILSEPNNILGIEYLKALRLLQSPIRPWTLRRKGSAYHDLSLNRELASASAIRRAIHQEGFSQVFHQLPPKAGRVLKAYFDQKGPLDWDDFSALLHYQLLSLPQEELTAYTDVSPDLAARIRRLLPQFQTATSFASLLKTRQLTHTRITRALCHILLADLKEASDRRKELGYPVYAKILGFRRESQSLLSLLKQSARIPILSRASHGQEFLRGVPASKEGLFPPQELLSLFQQDVFAAHVYESVVTNRYHTPFCHEYTRKMLIV